MVGRAKAVRRRRLRARALTALTALLAVGALVFAFVLDRGHGSSPNAGVTAIPSSPVVVLNATASQGAAGRLAQRLRSDRVKITLIGDLTGWQRRGWWIMFAPGQQAQAVRLARLIPERSTVTAIDPAVQAATGRGAKIVVVIG